MYTSKISDYLDYANTLRKHVHAEPDQPTHLIKRPVGMRTKRFDSLIKRIIKNEHKAMQLLLEGLSKVPPDET